MFTKKIHLQERELRRVLQERLVPSGQSYEITVSGWSSASPNQELVLRAFGRTLMHDSKLPQEIRKIEGMSGQIYRSFINNLVETHADARYLEIGSWAGSTATAALYGNTVKCVCVDNWSQFGGPKEVFFANIERVRSEKIDFTFIEDDFRNVNFGAIGSFNIFMFDGPHSEQDQYDGVMLAQQALDKSYILIVDDWNWTPVRNGTFRALLSTSCAISFWIEVRTTFDDTHANIAFQDSDWHNGYFIAVIEKRL